jgi:hypothetical protein
MGTPPLSGVEVRRPSRSTSSYLFCRGGAYYLRVRVPLRHQDRVGSIEVRRSLHVHHPRTARRLALKLSARVFEVFDMLETTVLTKPQVQGLFQQALQDMERSAGIGFVPSGPRPDLEIAEQRDISKERIASLSEQIAGLSFSPQIKVKAMLVAGRAGMPSAQVMQAMHLLCRQLPLIEKLWGASLPPT